MKADPKSARNRKLAMLFLFVAPLCACADVRGPQWLTGEPDESVLSAPRVVGKPSGATKAAWPNLADVPVKKPDFTKPDARAKQVEDLTSDKLKAQAEMERIRNIPLEGQQAAEPLPSELPFAVSTEKR